MNPHPRNLVQRVLAPIERFLRVEASGGIVLLLAAAVALLWVNSRFGASYETLWHTPLSVQFGRFTLGASWHFVVDEVLMTIFFFVVGLEIRREIHSGELSDLRRAVLPIAAAIGGMIAPALIYWALNRGGPQRAGWGVPVATDIAFAVGVLALLGKRVPPALRVLLLALAIIDDIGAIIVIACFYSSGVSLFGFTIMGLAVAIVLLLRKIGLRNPMSYVPAGVLLWYGALRAGIHPTISGVALGLLTPAQPRLVGPPARPRVAETEAIAPAVRLAAMLHPWVAYGVMPLFALANAGVPVRTSALRSGGVSLPLGIVVGLVVGKPIGILLATGIVTKLRIATLPRGLGAANLLVLGCVAGVGFTMSIFIAGLAFPVPAMLEAAKLSVLVASVTAGIIALLLGRLLLIDRPVEGAARTAEDAECSTET
jgi:NhaA family Na+:H+ antiporter